MNFIVRYWLHIIIIATLLPVIYIACIYVYVVIHRQYADYTYRIQKAAAEAIIAPIHLTLHDADGTNLPPMPSELEKDATVAGIDANNNHIRDDIELKMYELYPILQPVDTNFTQRAAGLQYAQTEQILLAMAENREDMDMYQYKSFRASKCINEKEIEKSYDEYIFNSQKRVGRTRNAFENLMGSFTLPSSPYCDL
jgi:hypothetical protein